MSRLRIEDIIAESGCKYEVRILWLPPYHCHFNPIEMVWGLVKRDFEDQVLQCSNDKEVEELWDRCLAKISQQTWQNCVAHVDRDIVACFEKEGRFYTDKTNYQQFKAITVEDDAEDEDEDVDDPQPLPTEEISQVASSIPGNQMAGDVSRRRSLRFPLQESTTPSSQPPDTGIIELSDDEADALELIRTRQEALTNIWEECSRVLCNGEVVGSVLMDHCYSSYDVRNSYIARQVCIKWPTRLSLSLTKLPDHHLHPVNFSVYKCLPAVSDCGRY